MTWMIEAMSQFEIPRPTRGQASGPDRCRARARPAPCASSAVSMDTASQHPNSCHRYFLLTTQHGAPLPISTPSCPRFAPRWPGPQ